MRLAGENGDFWALILIFHDRLDILLEMRLSGVAEQV